MTKSQRPAPSVVLVISNPPDTNALNLTEEIAVISDSVRQSYGAKTIDLVVLVSAKPDDLRRELQRKHHDIVHFSGHGSLDGLIFTGPTGLSQVLDVSELSRLLRDKKVNTVVINACHSSFSETFSSCGIEYTIAMEGPAMDKSCIEFSKGFYQLLAQGGTIPDAFREGMNSASENNARANAALIPGRQPPCSPPITMFLHRARGLEYPYEVQVRGEKYPALLDDDAIKAILTESLKCGRSQGYMSHEAQRGIGECLFDSIFKDVRGRVRPVYNQIESILTEENASRAVSFNLVLDPADDLYRLPWELCWTEDIGFIFSNTRGLSLRRLIESSTRIRRRDYLPAEPKVLMVFAEPNGIEAGIHKEQIMVEEMKQKGVFGPASVEVLGDPTPKMVSDALKDDKYNVFHFAGIDPKNFKYEPDKQEGIVLVEEGKDKLLPEPDLIRLFGGLKNMNLVILNTCDTSWRLAPRLVSSGVPTVIAMQYPTNGPVANEFTKVFYRDLFDARYFGDVSSAVLGVRLSLNIGWSRLLRDPNSHDCEVPGRDLLDWVTPTITTRRSA